MSTLKANRIENLTTTDGGISINNSGDVGVGTTSPGADLHVKSSGATEIKSESTGDNALVSINNSSSIPWILTQRNDTSDGFSFRYNGNNYVNIDTSGNVLIGSSSSRAAGTPLDVTGGLFVGETSNNADKRGYIYCAQYSSSSEPEGFTAIAPFSDSSNNRVSIGGSASAANAATEIKFYTATNTSTRTGSERMVIGSAGNVTIKTLSSASAAAYYNPAGRYPLNIDLTQGEDNWFNFAGPYNATVGTGSFLRFRPTFLNTGNHAGMYAGGVSVDSQHTDFVIGSLYSSSSTSGSASKQERMRVTAGGSVLIGTTDTSLWNNNSSSTQGATVVGNELGVAKWQGTVAYFNRMGNDGNIIAFIGQGTTEGNISLSGTTVSFNGGHLARWSQLSGGAERTEILRGSVLSNLDEMCEWGDEDNEQLNRMQVSSVEGDPNVAGVFQAWDDDDDIYTNDFYCAMTGDFVIRIAQGTTVARGDLLMSAGDGTAKPQDDDIVRSKTIAKVTSTTVSETYSDGSYCVPCVLMAC